MKKAFGWIAKQSERWPWLILALVSVITVIGFVGITRIESDFNFQAMLPEGKESVQVFEEIEDDFGGTQQEQVLIKSGEVLRPEILRAVVGYQAFLEEQPAIWGKLVDTVDTPLDDMYLVDENGEYVEGYFGRPVFLVPDDLSDEELVARVEANLQIQREVARQGEGTSPLVAEDGTALLMNLNQVVSESDTLVSDFEDLTREYFADAGVEDVFITGSASWTRDANKEVARDTSTLFVIAFAFILVILFLTFLRVTDVLFTMAVVMVAIVWVMGFTGWAHIPFNYISIGIMPLLLGLGIAYAIHVLSRYYEERKRGGGPVLATRNAVTTVGVAVFMTAITTAIGFASFGISEMPPMRSFGVLCLVGVLLSFLLSVTMLPAAIILRDRKSKKKVGLLKKKGDTGKVSVIDRALVWVSLLAEHHRAVVMLVTAIVVGLAVFSSLNLDTKADFQGNLGDTPAAVADSEISSYFGGQENVYTLIKGDMTDPGLLQIMRDYEQALADSGAVAEDGEIMFLRGKIVSLADIVARQNQGEIPTSREEVVDILEFLQGRSGGEGARIVSRDLDSAIVLSTVESGSQVDQETVTDVLRNNQYIITEAYPEVYVGQSGESVLVGDVLSSLSPTLIKTSLLAFLLCLLVVSIIFRSLIFGMAATSVVFLSIALEFIALYVLGWPLDFMTVMVSALIIGAGIDFGIHVTHRFREEWALGCESVDEAVRLTVGNVGRALLSAAITTAGAFGILAISRVEQLRRFGGVTAFSLVFTLLVALLVLPTILSFWAERAERKNHARSEECQVE